MTPLERLGVGLGIIGIGIALFMGLPPPWWPDMPPPAVHGGVLLGAVLIILGASLVLHGTWSAIRQGRRMLPLIGMAVFGLGFLGSAAWYFWPNPTKPQSSLSAAETSLIPVPAPNRPINLLNNKELKAYAITFLDGVTIFADNFQREENRIIIESTSPTMTKEQRAEADKRMRDGWMKRVSEARITYNNLYGAQGMALYLELRKRNGMFGPAPGESLTRFGAILTGRLAECLLSASV
jgi:hypothetical protein